MIATFATSYQRHDVWTIFAGCMSALVNGATMPVFSVLFARMIVVLYETDDDQMKADAQTLMIAFIVSGVGAGFFRLAQVRSCAAGRVVHSPCNCARSSPCACTALLFRMGG